MRDLKIQTILKVIYMTIDLAAEKNMYAFWFFSDLSKNFGKSNCYINKIL